jgi:hypothetical protein
VDELVAAAGRAASESSKGMGPKKEALIPQSRRGAARENAGGVPPPVTCCPTRRQSRRI